MKKLKQTILIMILVFTLLLGTINPLVAVGNEGDQRPHDASVGIILNGEYIQALDQEPFINPATGRTMVPLRFISEALGYTVDWNGETQTVTIDGDLAHVVGTNRITRISTGELLEFDSPSFIVAATGRTVVPLRFIAEALNATVEWDEASRSAIIWQAGFEPIEINPDELINLNIARQTPRMNRNQPNENGSQTGGSGNGGNNSGGGNDGDNIIIPEPGDQPYIRVITPFPDGETAVGVVFFDYIAVPSIGARITHVTYTMNGRFGGSLYSFGEAQRPGDTFGSAVIPMTHGENRIVVTVMDTAGLEASFEIPQVPYRYNLNFSEPCPTREPFQVHATEGDAIFAANRINFRTI